MSAERRGVRRQARQGDELEFDRVSFFTDAVPLDRRQPEHFDEYFS